MGAVYEVNINGDVTYIKSLTGTVSADYLDGTVKPIHEISGSTSAPGVIDRTAIHYNTVEGWNATPNLVSQKGHLYIYKDWKTKEGEDGKIIYIPAMKIGDGTSYLIDMPIVSTGDDEAWIEHINNWQIHVSDMDRTTWDNKVSTSVNEASECLIFNI